MLEALADKPEPTAAPGSAALGIVAPGFGAGETARPGWPTTNRHGLGGAGHGRRQRPGREVLLKIEGRSKSFGGVVAVSDVSFEVRRGEILGVIGPTAPARPRSSTSSR